MEMNHYVKIHLSLTGNFIFLIYKPFSTATALFNTFGYVLCRFEDDEMERQENPIYGNICLDGRSSS